MSEPTPPHDEVVAAMRARSRTGWESMEGAVHDRVRATSRPGRLMDISSAPSVAGDLTLREQALRAVLARALRTPADFEPSAIDLDIDDRRVVGIRVGLRADLAAGRRAVITRAQQIVRAVVRDILGEAQLNLLTHTVDVDVDQHDDGTRPGTR